VVIRRREIPSSSRRLRSVAVGVLAAGLIPAMLGAQQPAATVALDSLNDGPHVYWQSDTDAFVFYLCRGDLALQRYRTSSNLKFAGMCGDSLRSYEFPAKAPTIEPYEFDGVDRLLVVSDIHGDYGELVAMLRTAGVIDDADRWSWDKGHLVVNGDVFDRGDAVTECLWLIHRLEREAREAGGRVHYLLGNHEMMVLRGDNRYVNGKYMGGIVRYTGIAHQDLYGPDMELGRWLRTKHVAVRVNDIVFVHGGLGPQVMERGLDLKQLNDIGRSLIDMRSYELFFSDVPFFVNGVEGPLWYRGYHYGREGRYAQITAEELDEVLKFYDAKTIVVGHSEVGQVSQLFGGRVYGVDVPVDALGGFEALLWQDGTFYRVGVDGSTVAFP
jgi:hypothetical protein